MMTDDDQTKTSAPAPGPAPSPEAAANARIKDLQARIISQQIEVKMLQGRFSNRDPRLLRLIKVENAELSARAQLLERALQGLMLDALEPRNAEEEATRYSILREATVELCKNTNVDPEIWKSLASSS